MQREYFFVYLIYGIVYLIMGILPLQRRTDHILHLPLVKSLRHLSGFGILHGISELITTLVISNLYPENYGELFFVKQVLKAASFAFLLQFGLNLLPEQWRERKLRPFLPTTLFLLWFFGFVYLMQLHGFHYHIKNPTYNIYVLRYFLGITAGGVASYALFYQGRSFLSVAQKKVARNYQRLAFAFLTYGLVDGLIVREMSFFPANIINNRLFLEVFGIPIQLLKILVGIVVMVFLMQLLATFDEEQRERVRLLKALEIQSEERRKLGLELHDALVQELFGTSLKVQLVRKNASEDPKMKTALLEIQETLGQSIQSIRKFIHASTLEHVQFRQLEEKLLQLAEVSSLDSGVQFSFSLEGTTLEESLPTDVSSQLYHIAQEAVHNVLKHAHARKAELHLACDSKLLLLFIQDDGVGIPMPLPQSDHHFGLDSMQSRAASIGAVIEIRNTHPGTQVKILLPWERRD